jgi:hypothetical protein
LAVIRPEAAAVLWRWREVLCGVACGALALWLWTTSSGLPAFFGLVLGLLGGFLIVSGIRQARFRSDASAPGVVEITEGRITYMGPVLGGAAHLDTLAEISFRRMSTGEGFWRLTSLDGKSLYIPEGALGSDALLDAFAPLADFDGGAMVRAVRSRTGGTTLVWRRPAAGALT